MKSVSEKLDWSSEKLDDPYSLRRPCTYMTPIEAAPHLLIAARHFVHSLSHLSVSIVLVAHPLAVSRTLAPAQSRVQTYYTASESLNLLSSMHASAA